MNYQIDLKAISNAISAKPFNIQWSIIQLHDEITPTQLLQTLFDVSGFVDEANVSSIFPIDRPLEEKVFRLVEFLQMLKYKPAANVELCMKDIMQFNRDAILAAMTYLVSDITSHKKRAYLALYLSTPDIPVDFSQDDAIQEEFKNTHKHLEGIKQSGNSALGLKREIQQMEEEKQQLLSKIIKIKTKVQQMPRSEQWLKSAQKLRTQQELEQNLLDKSSEQKQLIEKADIKLESLKQQYKQVFQASKSNSPDSVFNKLSEETKMNSIFVKESYPKMLVLLEQKLKTLEEITQKDQFGDEELLKLEQGLQEFNVKNAKLAEEKLKYSGDANLALFRQQASIISRKKEATMAKIPLLQEEFNKLSESIQNVEPKTTTKILEGEDFKRYVSELRGKSTNFKLKKAQLSAILSEFGILQRTEQILEKKIQVLKSKIENVEKKAGVSGYHEAQTNLEKVSEEKSGRDEAKGEKLEEISSLINRLTETINSKKENLAPIIHELRNLRQESQDIEIQYEDKRKNYDAAMFQIDSDIEVVDQEIKKYKLEYNETQSQYHLIQMRTHQLEVSQDKVMNEMKSYIGADEMIELVQKARGFKTYRELYNKKIVELESSSKNLKDVVRDAKIKHEPNIKQIKMFKSVKRLLELKLKSNAKILSGKSPEEGVESVTTDRLVLS